MKMWHEARKQERKIRGMLVDYRKRAERRQDFYEKIKADPTQFMQIHGRKCKIHLDPAVAAAGDGSAIIVPWQGQQDNLIDRFDVRAHLDYIPPVPKVKELEDISAEERQCNYERYRILAQNDFLGISEEKFLHQLFLEEQFGANAQLEVERSSNKKKAGTGAAIGYTYEDSDATTPFSHILSLPTSSAVPPTDPDGDSDSDVDMDVSIDVSKLDTSQAHELNGCGRNYGMKSNDFYSFLTKDADEADALRMAREEEQEKIMLSGRKSRRERRAQRERRFAGRPLSPPSYAAKEEPAVSSNVNDNESESRSPSPENSGKITYITSFGGEDELQPHSKISINFSKPQKTFGAAGTIGPQYIGQTMTYAEKVKENLEKLKQISDINKNASSESPKKPRQYLRGRSSSESRSRSRSRSRYRRKRSRSRSKSRGYRGRRDRRCSRSRSFSKKRRYTRSRSRSNRYNRSRSRSSKPRTRYRRRSTSSSSSSSDRRRDRARSLKAKTRSRSKSLSVDKNRESRSKSKPMVSVPLPVISPQAMEVCVEEPPAPPPIKRYYGRKRDDDTSSEEDLLEDLEEEQNDTSNSERSNPVPPVGLNTTNILGKPTTATTSTSFSASETKLSLQALNHGSQAKTTNLREKLKRKMQMLLNKQYKADKKAEIERTERQIQQQQEREDEMRELALKLRRRQRELRHKYGTPTSSPSKSSRNSDDEKEEEQPTNEINEEEPARSATKSPSRQRDIRDRDRHSRSQSRHSRSRRASPSRYRSRRSRSRSRGRRSTSRRRERSRDREYDRDRGDRDRNYRSNRRSSDRERYRDRNDRERSRERTRYRDRESDRDRDRYRDRNRDRDRDRERNKDRDRSDHSPKIARKLVDY